VRDIEVGAKVAREIGTDRVRVARLDLADQVSIADFVASWRGPLHVLVCNAGVMATPELRTKEGWEMQIATNHLGHFALALGLHGAMKATGRARVVVVSSVGHVNGDVDFDDLMFERRRGGEPLEGRRHHSQRAQPGSNRIDPAWPSYRGDAPAGVVRAEQQGRVLQEHRAGRGDVGAARRLAPRRGDHRDVLRGLRPGRPLQAGGSARRRGVCARPGARCAAARPSRDDDRHDPRRSSSEAPLRGRRRPRPSPRPADARGGLAQIEAVVRPPRGRPPSPRPSIAAIRRDTRLHCLRPAPV
jgi:short chain dehydrogenase